MPATKTVHRTSPPLGGRHGVSARGVNIIGVNTRHWTGVTPLAFPPMVFTTAISYLRKPDKT
jgi:hypothetical protein